MSSFRTAINRVIYPKKSKRKALNGPHKKGTCIKVTTVAPKKPCSARRAVAYVKLSNKYYIICKIPGETHNLRKFSSVLVRGGRVLDVPGCHHKIIHASTGVSDLKPLYMRSRARSKFGIKNVDRKHHVRQDTAMERANNPLAKQANRVKNFESFKNDSSTNALKLKSALNKPMFMAQGNWSVESKYIGSGWKVGYKKRYPLNAVISRVINSLPLVGFGEVRNSIHAIALTKLHIIGQELAAKKRAKLNLLNTHSLIVKKKRWQSKLRFLKSRQRFKKFKKLQKRSGNNIQRFHNFARREILLRT
jgi:small subunit ribosomal protein S12